MNDRSYSFKSPQARKGFEIDLEIKQAIEAIMQSHGVPLAAAEAAYHKIFDIAAERHEANQAQIAREAEHNIKFNGDLLEGRWGDQSKEKWNYAVDASTQLGLTDEMIAAMARGGRNGANLIEQLSQIGEKLAAAKSAPAAQSKSPAPTNQTEGATKVENPAQSIKALERKIRELPHNPEWLARFKDGRHPLHQAAVDEQHNLIAQLAALRAVARGDTSQAGRGEPQAAAVARAELARRQDDPAFMNSLKDARDWRHAENVAIRDSLLRKIAMAEAPVTRASRSAAAIRREMEETRHNPEFMSAISKGARAAEHDDKYHAAHARYTGLVEELASAESQEGTAATLATAAGEGRAAPSGSDSGAAP